jgi:predicted 3-demethylubiquinone-9 3-methyltransferase (glyoxalase superfamily)
MKERIQKITPFLWFDNQAEEAVNFYTSIFKKFKDSHGYSLRRRWTWAQR